MVASTIIRSISNVVSIFGNLNYCSGVQMTDEPLDLRAIKLILADIGLLDREEQLQLVAEIERLRIEPAKRQIEMAGSMYEHVSRLEKELQAERAHRESDNKTLGAAMEREHQKWLGEKVHADRLAAKLLAEGHQNSDEILAHRARRKQE